MHARDKKDRQRELSLEQSRGEGAGVQLAGAARAVVRHGPLAGNQDAGPNSGRVVVLRFVVAVRSSTAALPVRPSPVFLGALPSSGQFLHCLIIALAIY